MFRLCCTGGYIVLIILLACSIYSLGRRRPGYPATRSRREKNATLAFLVAGSLLLTYCWYCLPFSVTTVRDFTTGDEKAALEHAEALDLAGMLGIPRFWERWGINETPADPNAYVWPNLIDREALDYYSQKVGRARDSGICFRAGLEYRAASRLCRGLEIRYEAGSQEVAFSGKTYFVHAGDGDMLQDGMYEYGGILQPGGLQRMSKRTGPVNISLGRYFQVTQSLEYSELYGSLAAFWGSVTQLIFLDCGYTPFLVLVSPGDHVVS